jgi:hypothetical protein
VLAGVEQDVAGLHVAMDQALLVGGLQCIGDLSADPSCSLGGQGTIARQRGAQVGSLDVPHREVQAPSVLTGGVDRDDVRVFDRRGRVGLADEACAEGRVAGEVGRQDLECDLALGEGLSGEVHDPHTAASNLGLETEAADFRRQGFVHGPFYTPGAARSARPSNFRIRKRVFDAAERDFEGVWVALCAPRAARRTSPRLVLPDFERADRIGTSTIATFSPENEAKEAAQA